MNIQRFIGLSVLASLSVLLPCQVQAAPLLTVSTDQAMAGEQIASAAVVSTIIRASKPAEVQKLDACLTDLKLPQGAYNRLFRSVLLPSLRSGEQLYFVRAALNPYCQSLYSDGSFRHWFVAGVGNAYQVRHSGLGNNVRILNVQSNDSYDIVSGNCTAAECSSTTWRFTGVRYSAFRCSESRSSGGSGNDVETTVPCRR